jgi:single-strand DNA-binding protein
MSSSPAYFVGNITQDPKLMFTGSGAAKLSVGVACSHFWTDQSGEKQEKTSFFNVVAWRNLAEEAANVLEKGMRVVVVGRLEQRTYEDKDGQNRSIVELVADEIALAARGLESVTRKQRSSDGGSGRPPQKSRPAAAARSVQGTMVVEEDEPF